MLSARKNPSALILMLVFACTAAALAQRAPAQQKPLAQPTIIFMTDFGLIDDSVAICKGVMLGIEPNLRIIDLTHEVRPYSIADGARFLYGATPYYPAGTVFVVVVDPTVGSSRKAIVVKSKRGQFFVLPDNGLVTMVADRDGVDAVREITNPTWMIGSKLSSTFHGRDIFSPVGAHIARGEDWTNVGPELKQVLRLDITSARIDETGIRGEVIALDGHFGNVITNVAGDEFRQLGYVLGEKVTVNLAGKSLALPFVRTFADVPMGKSLLYIDSRGRIGLAVNQGNFASAYGVKPPQPITIPRPQINAAPTTTK